MADAINLTLSNGDSPSIIVSASNSVSSIVGTPDSSISLSVNPSTDSSVSINSVPTTQLTIASTGTSVATVSQLNNSLTVSTAIQAPHKFKLRELLDVSGDPTDDQVLVYDQPTDSFIFESQSGGGGGSSTDHVINSDLFVTNSDLAFQTMVGNTIQNNTTIESILQQILSPYERSEFNSFSIYATTAITTITVGSNNTQNLEVGDDVTASTVNYSLTLPGNVLDNSVTLERSIDNASYSSYQSGLSDSPSGNVTLGTEIGISGNPNVRHRYRFSATDNGNPNGQVVTIYSGVATLNWKNRMYLMGSSASVAASSSDVDFNNVIFNNTVDNVLTNDPGTASVLLDCNVQNQLADNYSYISYPASWGIIQSIKQNDSTDVTTDFSLVIKAGSTDGSFARTNAHGIVIPYYLYKTFDSGAYHADVELTVTLS